MKADSTKKKFKYYLCVPNTYCESLYSYDDLYENIVKYTNITMEEFQKLFNFCCDFPDIKDGCDSYSTELTDSVLEYNKLSQLIEDYIFCDKLKSDDAELDLDYIISRFAELQCCSVVVKLDKKTKLLSFVPESDLNSCFEKIIKTETKSMVGDMLMINSLTPQERDIVNNFDFEDFEIKFKTFISKIESLIVQDYGLLTNSSVDNSFWCFCIMKENGVLHDKLKNIDTFIHNTINNGFVYECGYNRYKQYILFHIMTGKVVGCSLNVAITETKETFNKVYGFAMVNRSNKILIVQSNAKVVMDAYTTNPKTNQPIPADKNVIFCGEDADDVICGFDLV